MPDPTDAHDTAARPGYRPHDLRQAPTSRREFPGPPGAEIRRICRAYEVKCAGKYHPVLRSKSSKARTGASVPAWAVDSSATLPNHAPRGERYVFELSRAVQEQVELLEDMLTTKDEEIKKLERAKQQPLSFEAYERTAINTTAHHNPAESDGYGSGERSSGDELAGASLGRMGATATVPEEAMMPVSVHEDQLRQIETGVASFYRSLQRQLRTEKKRLQEEHAQQLEQARDSAFHTSSADVTRLSHELNKALAQVREYQEEKKNALESHRREIATIRTFRNGNNNNGEQMGPASPSAESFARHAGQKQQQQQQQHPQQQQQQQSHPRQESEPHQVGEAFPPTTRAQQVTERSMKAEQLALMSAWQNDKARATELQTENAYLRGRVTQLNALVRMMQDTL